MRHKPLLLCMLAATVLGSGIATTSVVLAREPVGTASARIANSESKSTAKSIAQQIAKLEVERAVQETIYIPEAPTIRAIDAQLRSLRKRLAQLQPNGYQATVKIAVSEAIKAKIAELEIERAKQGTRYIPESPVIQAIDARLRSLRKRLAQIQRSAS